MSKQLPAIATVDPQATHCAPTA